MLTYAELKDLIEKAFPAFRWQPSLIPFLPPVKARQDWERRNMYLRYLDNVRDAQISEEERQRKYRILLNAVDAKNEEVYFNKWEVIVRDTVLETAGDVVGVVRSPTLWLIAVLIFAAYLVLKFK